MQSDATTALYMIVRSSPLKRPDAKDHLAAPLTSVKELPPWFGCWQWGIRVCSLSGGAKCLHNAPPLLAVRFGLSPENVIDDEVCVLVEKRLTHALLSVQKRSAQANPILKRVDASCGYRISLPLDGWWVRQWVHGEGVEHRAL